MMPLFLASGSVEFHIVQSRGVMETSQGQLRHRARRVQVKWHLSQQKCVFVLSGHFRLDPESGELRTAVNLDYEEVSQYVILIQANKRVSSAAGFQRSGNFLL